MDLIHDELSHIAQNYTGENVVIEYTDKEREFEKSYPVPDEFRGPDTPEDAKWSFHLMKDTFDAVRTAQALENCAAGQSYIDGAVRKSLYLMYMENENGERVAEIEIRKAPGTGYNGSIRQFQAKNDRSLDGRYKDVALQWISDCELKDDCSCDDINKFGQNVVFHGTGETDYHHDEIDEVTLARITKEENKKRNESRIKAAAELYGTDASGNILKPEIPDDLLSFK